MDKRYGKVSRGPAGTRVLTSDANWKKPIKWDAISKLSADLFASAGGDPSRPGTVEYKGKTLHYAGRPRVFCASLADVFEDWQGPIVNSNGDRLIVTGDRQWTPGMFSEPAYGGFADVTMDDVRARLFDLIDATPNLDWLLLTKRPENITQMLFDPDSLNGFKRRKNVWFGASVENADYLHRIDSLKSVGDLASVLFLSCEPLLGSLPTLGEHLDGIDWVIAGGESGPDARPSHPDWFRSIRDQCETHVVPFQFKQWGEWLPIDHALPSHEGSAEESVWRDKPSKDDLPMLTLRVGTKKAGRMLDGVLHDAFPVALSAAI